MTVATMTALSDLSDPRLAPYRSVRERDLVGRAGRFVAEGEVVVRLLLSPRSRFAPESILVGTHRIPSLAPLFEIVPPDVPVLALPREAMEALVGFPIHRGLLAIGRRGTGSSPILPPAGPALVLGLIGLSNHDNVGAAFRNAAAFGADAVLLDETSADPLYRKAIRVSAGTALTVPFRRGGTAAALLEELEASGFSAFALSPSAGDRVEAVAWPDRTALLVGSEGSGLPADILARLPGVRIAMAPGVDSLNVATAAAIALHAVRNTARQAGD